MTNASYYNRLGVYPIDPKTMGFIVNAEAAGKDIRPLIEAFDEDVRSYFNILKLIRPGAARAVLAQNMMDKEIAFFCKKEGSAPKPICAKGCAHCCHICVSVCGSEVDRIMEVADRLEGNLPLINLVYQAGKEADDFYTEKMGKYNRCVFLDDESLCRIYEARPLACRSQLAVGNQDLCSMDVLKQEQSYIYIMASQAIINALYLLEMETVGDLATALLKRKGFVCQST